MDIEAVETAYARWAPVYDWTFGAATQTGRKTGVAQINRRQGTVLEVGVGTGLALDLYAPHLSVTGIDFSEHMLEKAREKVARRGLRHVVALRRMDARQLDFPDASFDTVAAMHVLSVVPEPERVMAEIARVLKPGGKVVITNHFKAERGMMAFAAARAASLSDLLGWHSDFSRDRVLNTPGLELETVRRLPPLGMMTLLVLTRR